MTDKESPDNQRGNEQNLDWDSQRLINHPKGMEQAMAENISKMEEQTRAIIESGSIEEIEAALERNLQELAALQKHMEKLTNRDLSQIQP